MSLFSRDDAAGRSREQVHRTSAPPPIPRRKGITLLSGLRLAESQVAVIEVARMTGFPNGYKVDLRATLKDPSLAIWDLYTSFDDHVDLGGDGAEVYLPATLLLFGVIYPGARSATSLGNILRDIHDPSAPLLEPLGGGCSRDTAEERWWLSPPAPRGRLTFVTKWSSGGIEDEHHVAVTLPRTSA